MASESAEAKAKLSAAAMSMKNIGSRKAFNQWAEMASEAAEAKAKLSAAAMSMKNIGSRKAFNQWAEMASEAAEAKAKAQRCCHVNEEHRLEQGIQSVGGDGERGGGS